MHPKWLIALGMVFIVCSILSGVLEMSYLGNHETSTLWKAMSAFDIVDSSNPLSIASGVVVGMWNLIKAAFQILLWDYAFFTGYWLVVKYLFMTISLGIVVALFLSLRGTSSG